MGSRRGTGPHRSPNPSVTMSIPEFVRKAFPEPLSLRDAIEIIYASEDVPPTAKAALKSAALDGVRYARRSGDEIPGKEEALRADVRPLLSILPAAARVAAEVKGHRNPSDHAGRARRFVETLTGGRSVDRSKLRFPCPPEWRPLVDAIPERKNANGEMSFLARCCMVAGIQDSPATMPSYEQIVQAARHISGEPGVRRATHATMSMYRTARGRLLAAEKCDEARQRIERRFAVLPTASSSRTCHLGVEPKAAELVEKAGLVAAGMSPDQMLRVIAPGLAADYDYWAAGPGSQHSDQFLEQCHGTLLRVVGWVIRAGHGESLREMELLDLFLYDIEVADSMQLNPRLLRRIGRETSEMRATVSLLEFAAEAEAEASLRRSTVTDAGIAGVAPNGRPWYTAAMHANCSRLWTMTADVYRDMSAQGGEPARQWALVESRWGRLQKQLSKRKVPGQYRIHAKDKLKLVQTVTLPQLVCVGLPLRRREVHALRAAWLAAVRQATEAGHSDPSVHPEVIAAERRYFDANLPFIILSLAIDDGLRRKQYTRGRLGHDANFRIELERANGVPVALRTMTTHWSGEKNDPAHLKIREKNNSVARREGRIVRRGLVDHVALWDLIHHWRPRQLVRNGVIPSLSTYDIEDDLRTGKYALFPSAMDVSRPEKSRTDVGILFGRELHYVAKTWLRPELPAWKDLGKSWRALWAMHISRLLIGSYWGGARGDWRTAAYLTMDTEATLRAEYSEIDDGLRDRIGPNKNHWEHLNAYDPWLDRLFYSGEEFDLLDDPDLPLPPHLQGQVRNAPAQPPRHRRIRRARPGQQPPRVNRPGTTRSI